MTMTGPRIAYCILSICVVAATASARAETPNPSLWSAVVWLEQGCTGTLVSPFVILYASHCGTSYSRAFIGQAPGGKGRYVELKFCVQHPDGGPGTGLDVAYCVLSERVTAIHPLRLATQEEFDRFVKQRTTLTLVGFGRVGPKPHKRVLVGKVEQIRTELHVDAGGLAPCGGDSGGPALVRIGPGQAPSDWRVIGIASSRPRTSPCGVPVTGRFTIVPRVLGWLEQQLSQTHIIDHF